MTNSLNIAIYRIHYGLDFLRQSIDSIIDEVDLVVVIYSLDPWVKKETVKYLGKTITMPALHEDVKSFMDKYYSSNHKVDYFRKEVNTPLNQYKKYLEYCVDRISIIPEKILFIEPDMVFKKGDLKKLFFQLDNNKQLPCLGCTQIEIWKDLNWRVPQRNRIGPMVWMYKDIKNLHTGFGTYNEKLKFQSNIIQNYNFGFCLNPKTMLYKHLAAINFSEAIKDSIPSQTWYVEKWLNWNEATTNLEIAAKATHLIPQAEKFNIDNSFLKQITTNYLK